MLTDHIEPKQKDFKLLIRLPPVCCALAEPLPQEIAQFVPQSFAKCAVGDRHEAPEIFILLDQKWSVGSAHPTGFSCNLSCVSSQISHKRHKFLR
jgi:hypothetical protein